MDQSISYQNAIPAPRGCGATRDRGAAYAECGLSPYGKPVEEFLVDPISVINTKEYGLSPVSQIPIYDGQTYHVLDWIGSQNYPNAADWFEEVRRFGMSQKLTLSPVDLSRLTKESKLLAVHGRAYITNLQLLDKVKELRVPMTHAAFAGFYDWAYCPKRKNQHESDFTINCAGWLWNHLTKGLRVDERDVYPRAVKVVMPSFSYLGSELPEEINLGFAAGIFAALPITRVAVIQDDRDGTHKATLKKLEGCKLPVELVEA